jgi:cytidylate kinase
VGDQFRPEVAGVDVSRPIREDRVNAKVSSVAAMPEVRDWVNAAQRAAAQLHPGGVVVDGRDIGSVVFPDAAVKIYLDAAPEVRAKRRVLQDGAGDVATVAAQLRQRDKDDSTRAVSPLKPADGAVRLDTTAMSFEEQVNRIVSLARKSF